MTGPAAASGQQFQPTYADPRKPIDPGAAGMNSGTAASGPESRTAVPETVSSRGSAENGGPEGARSPEQGKGESTATPSEPRDSSGEPLSDGETQQVRELQSIDAKVRAHEAAHIAASGGYARGGANFSYSTGPDGKRYATGGEVQIDTSPVPDNPEATVRKMQIVRRAALAPAEPSPQDRSVAATAASGESQARQEMVQENRQSAGTGKPGEAADDNAKGEDASGGRGAAGTQGERGALPEQGGSSAPSANQPPKDQPGVRPPQGKPGIQPPQGKPGVQPTLGQPGVEAAQPRADALTGLVQTGI